MTAVRTRLAALAAAGALTTTALAATAASAWAVTVPHRGDSSLAVTRTFTQGGAGHGWMALIYRNVTRHACTVYGYPGLDAISSTGHVLAHATRTLSGSGSGGHLFHRDDPPGRVRVGRGRVAHLQPADQRRVRLLHDGEHHRREHQHRPPPAGVGERRQPQVHPTVAGTPQYPDFGPAQQYWITRLESDLR